MKVQRIEIEQEEQFVPFAIQINVESKEEAQALYAIFNHSRNSGILNNAAAIKDAIGEKYWVFDKTGGKTIAKGISYDEFYYGEKCK